MPYRAESAGPRQSERSHKRTQPRRVGNAGTASWSRGQGRARRWDELHVGKKARHTQRRAPARGHGRAEERGPRKELAGDPEGDGARRRAWLCAAWASTQGKIHSWAHAGRTGSSAGGVCAQGAEKKLCAGKEVETRTPCAHEAFWWPASRKQGARAQRRRAGVRAPRP
jgi:hypothetical protein